MYLPGLYVANLIAYLQTAYILHYSYIQGKAMASTCSACIAFLVVLPTNLSLLSKIAFYGHALI